MSPFCYEPGHFTFTFWLFVGRVHGATCAGSAPDCGLGLDDGELDGFGVGVGVGLQSNWATTQSSARAPGGTTSSKLAPSATALMSVRLRMRASLDLAARSACFDVEKGESFP